MNVYDGAQVFQDQSLLTTSSTMQCTLRTFILHSWQKRNRFPHDHPTFLLPFPGLKLRNLQCRSQSCPLSRYLCSVIISVIIFIISVIIFIISVIIFISVINFTISFMIFIICIIIFIISFVILIISIIIFIICVIIFIVAIMRRIHNIISWGHHCDSNQRNQEHNNKQHHLISVPWSVSRTREKFP